MLLLAIRISGEHTSSVEKQQNNYSRRQILMIATRRASASQKKCVLFIRSHAT